MSAELMTDSACATTRARNVKVLQQLQWDRRDGASTEISGTAEARVVKFWMHV